jgi:hypothetical protein
LLIAGYVLGAVTDLHWIEGVTGAQILTEFNQVFGTALVTVGNNRVIRFRYDLPPTDGTGKYRDFHKGVDADWAAHHRAHGDRDQIQNFWSIRGASYPCGSGSPPACTCQSWSRSIDGNAQLGGNHIRVTQQSVTSDIIQDEALAEFVVRRQMRMTNRLPDTATVEAVNDPNVHPGTKVGLIDHTYGINTEALRLCTTQGVDRTGNGMTLALVCGDPGDEGTVTHGVEKVCNDTHADVDVPGSFDPPDFDFPPIDVGVSFDPVDLFPFDPTLIVVGGTEDPGPGGGSDDLIVDLSGWQEIYSTVTTITGHLHLSQDDAVCRMERCAGGRCGQRFHGDRHDGDDGRLDDEFGSPGREQQHRSYRRQFRGAHQPARRTLCPG